MGKRKKLEKAAKKAYKRARKAVDEAVRAAAAVDDHARKRAASLATRLASVPVPLATRDAGGDRGADIDLTPPLPRVEDTDADTAAEFAGAVATTAPHDPELDRLTLQALRDVASARGLRNVSRLTKAQLIERLSE